jgi:hypothetical protein
LTWEAFIDLLLFLNACISGLSFPKSKVMGVISLALIRQYREEISMEKSQVLVLSVDLFCDLVVEVVVGIGWVRLHALQFVLQLLQQVRLHFRDWFRWR